MKDRIHDPALDDLVRQINQEGPATGGDPPRSAPEPEGASLPSDREVASGPLRPRLGGAVDPGGELGHLLEELVRRKASDLLLIAGEPPVLRLNGSLRRLEEPPLCAADVAGLVDPLLSPSLRRLVEERGAADLSTSIDGESGAPWRFRVNVHRQRGALAAAVRALPRRIPRIRDLNLPDVLTDLVRPGAGLVLVCGPTGAGKSTTLAGLVGHVNQHHACHVITIEEPVEFEHRRGAGVVEHVEVGRDAPSFSDALRASLRQDPDVILVGEMRDLDTISTALTAAETGHLVLSTLHTSSAVRAVDRIVDVFPSNRQEQIRQQLAQGLRAVIAQQLLPRADGEGRVPAVEVLKATYPVRNLIRRAEGAKLYNEITLGSRQGMRTLEDSLCQLVRQGVVVLEEARLRANQPEELEALLRR